jgi:beta-mannosidase
MIDFRRLSLNWTVGPTEGPQDEPEETVPARVPGAVQLDWARAHDWPDHNSGDNFKDYRWMEDRHWLYRAELPEPDLADGERLYFSCAGIDYAFQVRVGGTVLLEQEGMFTPVELDLTDHAGGVLEVLVLPAPKSHHEEDNRDQANQSCKPAVSYGWDFHPRLVPLGICNEARLEVRPAGHLRDAELAYELDEDLAGADLRLHLRPTPECHGTARWTLQAPDGTEVLRRVCELGGTDATVAARLDEPDLWWPNGQGAQALYGSRVELLDEGGRVVQELSFRTGFRRVRMVMAEGTWNDPPDWPAPTTWPKPRSKPPTTLEVNGRRIFAKGSNWVGPDIFHGLVDEGRYRPLLELARDAHMNLLRCWGGSPVQKEAFFDLCDELGLMVWQEFPLSCNNYEGTPAYLRVLDRESRSIIHRVRRHACVALWCGGNELFNSWSGMTDQSLAIRLLNRNCYELDPDRPFLATAPLMGMAHGPYWFKVPNTDEEVFQVFPGRGCTAYTEFGISAPAPVEVLRRTVPESDLPPRPEDEPFESSRAKRAFGPHSNLDRGTSHREYFGDPDSLEDMVQRAQYLQGVGLQFVFEEARRQRPRCGMALNWCLNEPCPRTNNNSIVTYPCHPKPAVEKIAEALRPALASARVPRYSWEPGEMFEAELFLLNDGPEAVSAGEVSVILRLNGYEQELLVWRHEEVLANSNLQGPVARLSLPTVHGAGLIELELRHSEEALSSDYTFRYRVPEDQPVPPFP